MLQSPERTIEDFDPPVHRVGTARQRSRFSALFDPIVQSAYGPPVVLRQPKYLAMDPQHRLIATDPADHSVHVLDLLGKESFRILAGRSYRLKSPEGVAADAEGNIYLADSETGVVLVYDRSGTFLRKLGLFHGENIFQRPTAVAIHKSRGRIYVADTPRNVIGVLDLRGTVIRQLGKGRNGQGEPEFQRPTSIAVDDRGIAVLDSDGTRVWLLDLKGHPTRSFKIGRYLHGNDESNTIAFDNQGNVYISSVKASLIAVFRRDGEFVTSFGEPGTRRGEFREPIGLILDSLDRIYIADSHNGRVQVFGLSLAEKQGSGTH
jgi:DNA-binding beta-propeller fold protein YncE